MKKQLYSILEYRHSLIKNEIFHIGILFYFSEPDNTLLFKSTCCEFLQKIYPDVDYVTLERYLSYIKENTEKAEFSYANKFSMEEEFRRFIKKHIILEDSTVLQFSTPAIITNNNELTNNEIVDGYSKMLFSF